jgi:hypothetical protein
MKLCRSCRFASVFHSGGFSMTLGCYHPRMLDRSRGYPADPKVPASTMRADPCGCGIAGAWAVPRLLRTEQLDDR